NIPTITAKRTNLIYPSEVHEREEKYEAINLITDEINIGKPKQKRTENHYDYIMGNPPFVGRRYREKEQQKDIAQFFKYKDIDYVACWYYKAAELIKGTKTKCALVSTNSITQGEQVPALWKPVFNEFNAQVDFAYRTFIWDSESTDKAHVHCVVIGFSCRHVRGSRAENNAVELTAHRHIFTSDGKIIEAKNINGYLLDAPDIFIGNRSKPLCDVPPMKNGNVPLDGDALKIEAEDYPKFKDCPWIKQLMGGRELLHNEKRYVLWLVGVSPNQIKSNRKVYERVELCRKNRLSMKDPSTQKLAYAPSTFRDTNNPENYIALPMVSSENRSYIPMAYLHDDVIPTNQIQTIPDATLYHFGILTSSVHNAWMRAVCGRLESRYRYSKDIVYNNFPWCNPTEAQKAKIEKTAQTILDARAKYPDSSLADLYDETTMPPELRKAHKENDKAVLAAYSFDPKMSEAEIVAELFRMYKKLTEKK
ncbi:methylase, partial [bacterium]|nr:methylase [bacterium]